jgi:methionine-rich copper-binding protein CopC
MMKRIFALVVVLLALSAGPALSHATLVASSPEANSTVGEMPSSISLEFNERLLVLGEKSGNQIWLIGPAGDAVALENFSVVDEKLSASVTDRDFLPGTYLVEYRAVSADGHVIENKYEFTLESDVLQPIVTSNMDREESNLNRWLGVVSGLFLLMAIITTWWRFKDSRGR